MQPLYLQDARAIYENYASDRVVTKYLAFKPHKSIRTTLAFLRETRISWRKGKEHLWAILSRDGEVMGAVGLRPDGPRVEIGYVLGRRYWGNGFVTEAAQALISWAMKQKGVYRIWATCDPDNKASARVLKKLGMKREGILRKWIVRPRFGPVPRDCCIYSIVK